MKVKICGLTRKEDALEAARLGAWAVGFIFYPKSPRFIEPVRVREITAALPSDVLKVGVFVNETPEAMRRAADIAGITVYQLHGDEAPAAHDRAWIKAFRLKRASDLDELPRHAGALGFLLDAPGDGYGGTGRKSDWALAREARRLGTPIILSGGLNAENVVDAIAEVDPFALDLSSGVESAPGIKDHVKLAELFRRVHGNA